MCTSNKIVVFYIYEEVSGAFSGVAYFFNNIICDLVLLFRKNSLWASISLLLIKIFWSLRTNRQGLPETFLNFIFNAIFYVALCKFLCISNVPAVFFIKRLLTNFANFTENTSVPDFPFDQAAETQHKTLLRKRHRHRCFPVNLSNFLRISTSQNTSGQLPLCFVPFF